MFPYSPTTFAEKKVLSDEHFAANKKIIDVSETTPGGITESHVEFARTLGGDIVKIPVIKDNYGLFGWCSDGVLEKIANDGGRIVFGWNIWEWPQIMLTAEFHAVWQDDSGNLYDITPKPHGEHEIAFVPDFSYQQDFNFDNRPRNKRFRIYQPIEAAPIVAAQIAQMKPTQRAYEEKRAAKAGKSLDQWLLEKQPVDTLPDLIDAVIATVSRREELMDVMPGAGLIKPSPELLAVMDKSQRLIEALKSATRR